jgi:hypothetical protein
MSKVENKRPFLIIIAVFLVACLCLSGLLVLGGWFTLRGVSIGPTFSSAEALAYDILYETHYPDVDPASIRAVQEQKIESRDNLHAVLMHYQLAGEPAPQYRLLLARDNGREFFYEHAETGPAAEDENLNAASFIHENPLDSDVVVYGVVQNPAITRVVITWPNGWAQEAVVKEGTFLWFQSWSPVDGSPEPAQVTAYDEAGTAVSTLTLHP